MTPRRNGNLRYLFEDYTFDTERRELHRGTDAVSIAPQVFDLLVYLIRNRDRVVSKDDLISAVSNGRIVSDAARRSTAFGKTLPEVVHSIFGWKFFLKNQRLPSIACHLRRCCDPVHSLASYEIGQTVAGNQSAAASTVFAIEGADRRPLRKSLSSILIPLAEE